MKNWKYIYSLSICLLTLFFAGCSTQDELIDTPQINEDDQVTMAFSVRIPEVKSVATRAFGETVDTESIPLWLVVFDANGYLTEYKEATDKRYVEEEGVTYFKVTLSQTPRKRIIHFVANYAIDQLTFGSESEVIGGLKLQGDNDAYWQRVEFPNGINDDDETQGLMNRVPLVRNFAKITVKKADDLSDFVLEGYTVVNTPNMGSVAPYVGNGKFAAYVNGGYCASYADLIGQGYMGYIPSDMRLVNTGVPADGSFTLDANYMYERKFSESTPPASTTYLLIKGKYGTNASTYYKVDLGQKGDNGLFEYYHLLRNFHYEVNITSVTGNGYSTIALAAENVAFNNISASTATQSLLNISDGTSRLFVNFTNKIVVNEDVIELKYKYLPNKDNVNVTDNDAVNTSLVEAGNVIFSVGSDTRDSDGWNTIKIYPNAPQGGDPKYQSVTLYIEEGLSRTINFTLRTPWTLMDLATSPNVGTGVNSEVTVSFNIPNNLSEFMFPLSFQLESNRANIYNNPANEDAMVVWNGETTIKENDPVFKSWYTGNGSVFGFTKKLTYDDYLLLPAAATRSGYKTVNCSFLTNVAASTNTETMVYITNLYFTPTKVSFTQR